MADLYRTMTSNEAQACQAAEAARKLAAAIQSIELGNNGYADLPRDHELARALTLAGYHVHMTARGFRGFTKRAVDALIEERRAGSGFVVPLHAAPAATHEAPDYEAAILSRQSRHLEL